MALVTSAAGGYFKAIDHTAAKAVLVESKILKTGLPNKFDATKPRNALIADVTIFNTADELAGRVTPTILSSTQIDKDYLIDPLRGTGGTLNDAAFKIGPRTKNGNAFGVWESLDPATIKAVEAYIEKRDAAEQADAEANLPAFLS